MSDNNEEKDKDKNDNIFPFHSDGGQDSSKGSPKRSKMPMVLLFLGILVFFLIITNVFFQNNRDLKSFSEFKAMIAEGKIKRVEMDSVYFRGYTTKNPDKQKGANDFFGILGSKESQDYFETVGIFTDDFIKLLDDKKVVYSLKAKEKSYLLDFFVQWFLPLLLIFLVWRFLMKSFTKNLTGGIGGSIFSNPGQTRNVAVDEGKVETRFKDVAGVDEAKEELEEVVDFLRHPKRYTDIGGKIPRGVLLVGSPGTGKTLLARAVAGEAGVAFFRISGSDFVEMFVGVGASRVRDLFKQARAKTPCIVFIDELDAIGKSRLNSTNSNDEREQTLNQLLVEMDGFDSTTGLILLAATNRPDVLDPALLRPGRFDRQVVVDKPDLKGRQAILEIHAKNIKFDESADLASIAKITSGCSGADLANIINEAALLAVRAKRDKVNKTDLDEAVEKTMIGLQKKTRVIREEEKKIIAFHETGHAVVGSFTEGADKVHKVTIVPRGTGTLGYTFHIPEDDKHIVTEKQLLAEIDVLLGGRASEEMVFGMVSTGAANDLARATEIARSMITDYGMSKKFKNVALNKKGAGYAGNVEPQLVREYAETTQQYIDEEVANIIAERYDRTCKLLNEKKELVNYIAETLLEKETIEHDEFDEIILNENNLTALRKSEEDI